METLAELAQVYFANALLPAPLPTPPKSKMLPLLPTPCAVVLLLKSPRKNAKPGRADAEERWDAHKMKPASPASSSGASASGHRSPDGKNSSSGRASACERWDSNKVAISRGSSPGERWYTHKKPRQLQTDGLHDDGERSTGSNDKELDLDMQPPPLRALYAGPGFVASPEPSMLPIPSFMIRVGVA